MIVIVWPGEGPEEEAHQGHQGQKPCRAEGGGGRLGAAVLAEVHQQSTLCIRVMF